MGEMRSACNILDGTLGRSGCRWKDDRIDLREIEW
jgi:hypothetical protein